jgi:hypothetical protein
MNSFVVTREKGKYPLAEAKASLQRHGIVLLRDFLPLDTRDELRGILTRHLHAADANGGVLRLAEYPRVEFLLGDILAVRELEKFDFVFLRAELLEVLRYALDSQELHYFGDSSVQYGEGLRGFHKDNVDRYDGTKDDWKGEYGLVRCGFYCQDHERHSGGLKIRLGSHLIATSLRGKIVDVSSHFGDLVVWNMRLTHSGNARKLRGLPFVPLHPRIEARLPEALTTPEQMRRISAFCAFGRPGSHLDHYLENLKVRDADYHAYFQRARRPGETRAVLERHGVTFRQVNDYHGELDQDA